MRGALLGLFAGATTVFLKRSLVQASRGVASMAAGGEDEWKNATSIYDFTAKDIDGNELQELHDKYAESKGLCILAFPCNQFGGQEPWPEPEIKKWVTDNFGVKFDMFSKINVNGKDAHPLWKYLKSKQGGTLIDAIKWNFTKFLINKEGQPVKRYGPNVKPLRRCAESGGQFDEGDPQKPARGGVLLDGAY
ncbi:Phospholipid hydroperoxide glutathione peroxidase, mitochondrial [Branchiostoma belcheri]|nr:Phospholipid hydroperoxide glutathione peroxidase, mitochondrial [Branchiostoma belcheri]